MPVLGPQPTQSYQSLRPNRGQEVQPSQKETCARYLRISIVMEAWQGRCRGINRCVAGEKSPALQVCPPPKWAGLLGMKSRP